MPTQIASDRPISRPHIGSGLDCHEQTEYNHILFNRNVRFSTLMTDKVRDVAVVTIQIAPLPQGYAAPRHHVFPLFVCYAVTSKGKIHSFGGLGFPSPPTLI